MNKINLPLVLLIFGFAAGWYLNGLVNSGGAYSASDMPSVVVETNNEPLYWVAPMDPNYRRDKPGKSPMGMDLVPVYAEDKAGDDESVVSISPTVVNNLGVKVKTVEKGSLSQTIETVGFIQFDEEKLSHIHSRVEGWVEKLYVNSVGEAVKKGQPLFELYSPALVSAQEEFLAALRSGNKRLIRASRSRLKALDLTDQIINQVQKRKTVSQRITFVAEESGVVNHLNVREGAFVNPAKEIMSIGDLTSLWVIAEVFEQQSNWLAEEQEVLLTIDSLPGKNWAGSVEYVYPMLDDTTRAARVRVRVFNTDEILKPNMYANLQIKAGDSRERLHIPRSAVIRGGRINRVVTQLDEGRFQSKAISLGIESGDRVEVTEGLKQGDRVVVSAQFLLDSESNISAEIDRMESNNQEAAGIEDHSMHSGHDMNMQDHSMHQGGATE